VWHEGRYDLVAECVAHVYTRHDESGTRRVTPEEYAAEIAAARRERPNQALHLTGAALPFRTTQRLTSGPGR
jgi:hypothetical protein